MKITIQQLANLCNYSWDLQRDLGFHMQSPAAFRKYISEMSEAQLRQTMENLGLLFGVVRDIGATSVELRLVEVGKPDEAADHRN
jgi:hypothetical protein